jgi:hypothetical protein
MALDNKDCKAEMRVKTGSQRMEACPSVAFAFCCYICIFDRGHKSAACSAKRLHLAASSNSPSASHGCT